MKALKLLPYKGRPVFVFPVKVTLGEAASLHQIFHYPSRVYKVISHTARDAANLIQAEFDGVPCVEIEVFGPKGGVAARRWQGWESSIAQQMFAQRPAFDQIRFAFSKPVTACDKIDMQTDVLKIQHKDVS